MVCISIIAIVFAYFDVYLIFIQDRSYSIEERDRYHKSRFFYEEHILISCIRWKMRISSCLKSLICFQFPCWCIYLNITLLARANQVFHGQKNIIYSLNQISIENVLSLWNCVVISIIEIRLCFYVLLISVTTIANAFSIIIHFIFFYN